MVRKSRSDKKDTICKRCGHECSTPQKLREHLKRKNPCKPLQNQRDITSSIQEPIQIPISSKIPNKGSQDKKDVIAKIYKESDQIPEPEPLVEANIQELPLRNQPVRTRLTINKRPEESLKEWATRLADRIDKLTSVKQDRSWLRLRKRLREAVEVKYDNLIISDPEVWQERERIGGHRVQKRWENDGIVGYIKPELVLPNSVPEVDPEASPGPRTQAHRKDNKSKNLINEEFSRLGEITDEEKRDLEFREQEELGMALKRRAIAVHRAKVPKSHPDNGSDIRKFLESRRKQFRELLEKEFDKRGQFKFALCSLGKFLIDDKPGNENKKSSRSDWLRNKQIIVYNRAEIDDYLSNAFEQIIYLVEERGGKSNA